MSAGTDPARARRRSTVDAVDDVAVDPPGDACWVEASAHGHVVGLVEARLRRRGLTDAARSRRRATFRGDGRAHCDARCPTTSSPFASVVVPTICSGPTSSRRTIASLDALDYPDFEIVVVDNRAGGRDRRSPRSRRAQGPRRARARRGDLRGAEPRRRPRRRASSSPSPTTTRSWTRAGSGRSAAGSRREPDVDALGGLVLPSELDDRAQLWFEEYYGGFSQSFQRSTVEPSLARSDDPLFPYAPGRFGAGCNMAFRRPTLERLGGFDADARDRARPRRAARTSRSSSGCSSSGGTIGLRAGRARPPLPPPHRGGVLHARSATTAPASTAMYTSLVRPRAQRRSSSSSRRVPAGIRLAAASAATAGHRARRPPTRAAPSPDQLRRAWRSGRSPTPHSWVAHAAVAAKALSVSARRRADDGRPVALDDGARARSAAARPRAASAVLRANLSTAPRVRATCRWPRSSRLTSAATVRVVVGLAFCLVVPGWSIVGLLRLHDAPLEIGLTMAAGLCVAPRPRPARDHRAAPGTCSALQLLVCALCLASLLYQVAATPIGRPRSRRDPLARGEPRPRSRRPRRSS